MDDARVSACFIQVFLTLEQLLSSINFTAVWKITEKNHVCLCFCYFALALQCSCKWKKIKYTVTNICRTWFIIRLGKTMKPGDVNRLWQAQWGGTLAESVTETDRQSEKLRYEWWESYEENNSRKLHERKRPIKGQQKPVSVFPCVKEEKWQNHSTTLTNMMLTLYAGEVEASWRDETWGFHQSEIKAPII